MIEGSGTALPAVIRLLGLAHRGSEERHAEQVALLEARFETLGVAEARLKEIAAERQLPAQVTAVLVGYHENIRRQFPQAAP